MKTIKYLIITVFLTVFLGDAIAQTSYSFNDGIALGKSNNKKILVSIYIESDTWCDKMQTVYSAESIKNFINSNFVFVKLNAQGSDKCSYNGKQYTSSELAKFLGATGFPTNVFLNPDGTIIKYKYNGEVCNNYPGYVEAQDFEKILKYFATNQYKDTDLSKIF
jgi:thioredoxin-related protein